MQELIQGVEALVGEEYGRAAAEHMAPPPIPRMKGTLSSKRRQRRPRRRWRS